VRPVSGQLLRFGVVGVANTAITLIAFAALHHAGVPSAAASAIAFALGAADGYVLNRRWTFRAGTASAGGAARYALVQATAAALDARLTVAFEHALGGPALLAQAAALVPASALAFVLSRSWAFRARPAPRRRGRARGEALAQPPGTG
jgi:putative flippase GtrA